MVRDMKPKTQKIINTIYFKIGAVLSILLFFWLLYNFLIMFSFERGINFEIPGPVMVILFIIIIGTLYYNLRRDLKVKIRKELEEELGLNQDKE